MVSIISCSPSVFQSSFMIKMITFWFDIPQYNATFTWSPVSRMASCLLRGQRLRLSRTGCLWSSWPYQTALCNSPISGIDPSLWLIRSAFPGRKGIGGEEGGRGFTVFGSGVMCACDTVKPSGKSFVTSWKRTSTFWFLTASVGFMTCEL